MEAETVEEALVSEPEEVFAPRTPPATHEGH